MVEQLCSGWKASKKFPSFWVVSDPVVHGELVVFNSATKEFTTWKPWPTNPTYYVSPNSTRAGEPCAYNSVRGTFLKGSVLYTDYRYVNFPTGCVYLQRLVVETYHGPFLPKITANHLDHDRLNNSVDNLEHATQRQQAQHRRTYAQPGRWRRIYAMALSDCQPMVFPSVRAAARELGLSVCTIQRALHRKRPTRHFLFWYDIATPIPGEWFIECSPGRRISNLGRYQRRVGKIHWQDIVSVGQTRAYFQIVHRGKQVFFHRLVDHLFNSTPLDAGGHVDHIDGKSRNNSASNLQWMTPADHAIKTSGVPLTIFGVPYRSIKEAAEELGWSVSRVRRCLADGTEGFQLGPNARPRAQT